MARHGDKEQDWGFILSFPRGMLEVVAIDEGSTADELLRLGDRVLSIAGRSPVTVGTLDETLRRAAGGPTYSMVVQRGEERLEVVLPTPEVTRTWRPLPLAARLVVCLSCFALALLLGIADPWRSSARILCLALFSAAPYFLYQATVGTVAFLADWELWISNGMVLLHPLHLAFGFHFFASFPHGRSEARWLQWLIAAFYVGATASALARSALWLQVWLESSHGTALPFLSTLLQRWDAVRLAVVLSAMLGIPLVVWRNFRRLRDPVLLRRLRWVALGIAAGILPFFVAEVVGIWLGGSRLNAALHHVAFLTIGFVPPILAYAVLKHRVMGIRVVVRRGVQYLLARNVLRAALAVPAAVIVYRLIVYRHRTVAEVLLLHPVYLVTLAAAALSLRYRRLLLGWIDRRFFRQSYVQEQVLLRLIEEVAHQSTVEGVARLLSEQLEAALHPSSVTVMIRRAERGDLETAYSSTGGDERKPLARGRELVQRLAGRLHPQDVDEALHARLDADESAWLRGREAALLVPLADSEEDVIGLLVLGPKQSEEPYSPEDRRLLQALGRQAAITVDNLLLRDKVSRAAHMRREVLDRIERDRLPLLRECPRCGTCFDAGGHCPEDGEELVLTLPVERTLSDRYRLDRRLGHGGMGSVFRAWDLRLRRAVAVKVLMGRYFGNVVALRRLRREARAAAALSHSNIVSVYDYGTAGPDGAYLVMELVDGPTLHHRLRSCGRLDPRTAAGFLDQLLRAIEAAHRAGLVHRDVKPANILIGSGEDGEVLKLGDFGITKLRLEGDDTATALTEAGALVGTVRYMAPEQLTGRAVDHRADLWSVGVLAVEMLTGEHPFPGRSPAEILTGAISTPVRLQAEGGNAAPLEAVLRRALAPDPEDRFATAEELREALNAALALCSDAAIRISRGLGDTAQSPPAEGAATL